MVGTAGNVSVRVGELVAITPGSVDYDGLTAEQVCVVGLDGAAVHAPLRPSSELALHLLVYARTDAEAVVHTHAPASTALSCVLDELPASHYYTALFGGPVRVAPYAPFGTPELAGHVGAALAGRQAALMGNHGAVVIGPDLPAALERARYLEYLCEVHLRALSTGLAVRTLDAGQLAQVAARLPNAPGPPSPE